ncbi:YjjG family noncanonical pyrimidine nucleotidase [Companilactobacillus sp. HBUAS59544]|uniref:YjjG family noncanonical pyrimidine nucleotidase n=1 Tax=Companilactobacillus sp. HBUAS59544 TaxID=3109363 RepID=UPI002FF3F3AC
MKYPILLFDLDNTILDTKANAEKALHKMSPLIDFPFDPEQIKYWHVLNDQLWEEFEQKKLTRSDLLVKRFKLYFEHFNRKVDGEKFNQTYLNLFKMQDVLMPHAQNALEKLSHNHRIFAVSNGTKDKQYNQLTQSHLMQYFEKLYLSEDIGYQKPDPTFFKYVVDDLNWSKSQMLVIGDSLTADISGANKADLDSVWFNPKKVNNDTNFRPTFEISDLNQLVTLIDGQN